MTYDPDDHECLELALCLLAGATLALALLGALVVARLVWENWPQ